MFEPYLLNSAYIGLFFIFIILAKWVYNISTAYCTFSEITEKQNTAIGVSIFGYLIAIAIIYCSVLKGPSYGLFEDIINVTLYSSLGIVLLIASRFITDKALLNSVCSTMKQTGQYNLSIGIVQAANYIASGLLIGGSLTGEGSWETALTFYVLGQILLIIFSKLYNVLTKFDLQSELTKNNLAVSVSFSATMIALGIILLHALTGEFISWETSISLFLLDAFIGMILLPLVRVLLDKLLFSNVVLDSELQENNLAISLVEGAVAISIALVILFSL